MPYSLVYVVSSLLYAVLCHRRNAGSLATDDEASVAEAMLGWNILTGGRVV
jgi:hypothetical protein